jgi:hypothetical protein
VPPVRFVRHEEMVFDVGNSPRGIGATHGMV